MFDKGLFRQQAIAHQQHKLHGEVLVSPSLSVKLLTLFLVIWVGAIGVLLMSGQYAKQAEVQGWLEPPAGIVKVFSTLPSSEVGQLLVKEGDLVEAGQPLVKLHAFDKMHSGQRLSDALALSLHNQLTVLQHALNHKDALLQQQTQQLHQEVKALRQDLSELTHIRDIHLQRVTLMKTQLDSYAPLVKSGTYPVIEYQSLAAQLLTLQSESEQLDREYAKQTLQHAQKQAQLDLLPRQHHLDKQPLLAQISQLEQQQLELHSQSEVLLRASRRGRISAIQVKAGQRVNNQTPLLSVVPETAVVEAKMLVPIDASGFVVAGQSLDIRYHAFPYQKFGLYEGTVTSISQNVMLPQEMPHAPVALQEPVYLVTATLSQQHIDAYGKALNLKSGMTFSASISLGERSLIEWLFEPLMSLKGRLSA